MTTPTLPADHWARNGFLVLDTETTGTDVETAQVASISAGLMHPHSAPDIATAYIAVDMPEEASKVNGLTTEFLAEHGAPPRWVLETYVDLVTRSLRDEGRPVVIANAPYDLTVLDRECRRHGVPTITDRIDPWGKGQWPAVGAGPDQPFARAVAPVVDPIVLDKKAVKFRRRVSPTQGARQLITLCQVHGLGWDEAAAHTSEYDAVMAGRVTWQLMRKFPVLARMSLAELHTAQVGWYAEQAEGLRGWFASEAVKREQWSAQAHHSGDGEAVGRHDADMNEFLEKARSVDTAWPIRPWCPPPEPPITAADLAWVEDPAQVTP